MDKDESKEITITSGLEYLPKKDTVQVIHRIVKAHNDLLNRVDKLEKIVEALTKQPKKGGKNG